MMNCNHKENNELLHLNDAEGNIIKKCKVCNEWFREESDPRSDA